MTAILKEFSVLTTDGVMQPLERFEAIFEFGPSYLQERTRNMLAEHARVWDAH